MASFTTELFTQFIYSPELSYQDLLEREEELKTFLARIIEEHGGEFTHFEALGDTLRAQCVFSEYGEELFHEFCDKLAPALDNQVEARLLFVSREMDFLHLYGIRDGQWTESCLSLPPAGPIGRAYLEERQGTAEK